MTFNKYILSLFAVLLFGVAGFAEKQVPYSERQVLVSEVDAWKQLSKNADSYSASTYNNSYKIIVDRVTSPTPDADILEIFANEKSRAWLEAILQQEKNLAHSAEHSDIANDLQRAIDAVRKVSGAGSLAKYNKVRGFLGDGKVKAYLNNQQLTDFENLLKTAHDDVLKAMDEFKHVDEFAEMVRGFKDNPTAFTNAIKNVESFNGSHGWLNFWKLTPKMSNSLNTIANLKNANKIKNIGNATDIQLASIHSYTANGDFVNVPYRYNDTWFGVYNQRAIKHINEGLDELRKVPQRLVTTEVFSGKAFSKADFEGKFVGKINTDHPYNGYMSTSKLESVAEGFVELTTKWASGSGEKIAVIQRITPKKGVYIDDISDWGKNLGKTNHPTANPKVQIQEEVLLNSQKLKQVSEPIPVMENGRQKTIGGMKVYYVDFIEIL